MKKLLMICYYFPPLGMGGTQRPAKFAKYLSEFGWQITVITVLPISYWVKDQSLLSDVAKIRIIRTESFDPQRLLIKFRPAKDASGKGGTGRIAHWLNHNLLPFILVPDSKILWGRHLYRMVKTLLQSEKFDALYTTSPPHSVHLFGKKIARQYGLKWIADFRDAWAGSVVVHEPTALHRVLNRSLQKSVLKKADAVVAVTPGILTEFASQRKNACFHIPNGFDDGDFPSSFSKKHPGGKFVFCHCGSISRFSNPAPLLAALKLLSQQEIKKMHFEFIGYDAIGDFEQQIAAHNLSCFRLRNYQPHRKALQYLMAADALLLVAQGQSKDHFIPGKLYEYFGSRKPILAITNIPDTINLLRKYPRAMIADPHDPDQIIQALLKIQTTKWPRIDQKLLQSWSRREQAKQLAKILNQITE